MACMSWPPYATGSRARVMSKGALSYSRGTSFSISMPRPGNKLPLLWPPLRCANRGVLRARADKASNRDQTAIFPRTFSGRTSYPYCQRFSHICHRKSNEKIEGAGRRVMVRVFHRAYI